MALNPVKLQQDIKQLLTDMRDRTEVADDEYAQRLSLMIHEYIMSQTIMVSGVATAGGPTSQMQTAPVIAVIS